MGPLELSFIIKLIKRKIGDNRINPINENKISNNLINCYYFLVSR